MISEDPDEDADSLDDDAAIEALLRDVPPNSDGAPGVAEVADWPAWSASEPGLSLDPDTLAWFKASYTNWRGQVRAVLRAWMIANVADAPASRLAARADEQT